MDGQLEELSGLLRHQQKQLDGLGRQLSELSERSAVLLDCLEAKSVLRVSTVMARMHRRRFEAARQKHPCEWCGSLESVGKEITFVVAKFGGLECAKTLSAVSQAFGRRFTEMHLQLASFLSPDIYVIGGEGADEDVTCAVERMRPQEGSWQPAAPLPTPRTYCAAVAIAGHLYVVGGSDPDGLMLSTVERYDPCRDLWEPAPRMQVARAAVAATALGSQLCAVGGNNELAAHDSVECLDCSDPAAPVRWQSMPPMRSPRWAAAAAAIGRHLYVVGGRDAEDEVLSAVERLEPGAQRWCSLPPLRTPRASLAAAAVDGRLYVVGGYDTALQDLGSLERFDPDSNVWQRLRPMGSPRFALGALSCAGFLYVLGGAVGDVDRVVLGAVERYDPRTGLWLSICPLRTPRRRFGVAACGQGILLHRGSLRPGAACGQ